MKTLNELIEKSLYKDVDLSESEYKEKNAQADKVSKNHGVGGRAPLSEGLRHKRIQTNFYGTTLNVLLNLLSAVQEQNEILKSILVGGIVDDGNDGTSGG